MEKRYVFHYDRENPSPHADYHECLDQHDGKECVGDFDKRWDSMPFGKHGKIEEMTVRFDDGSDLDVYTYELEEVKEDVENE